MTKITTNDWEMLCAQAAKSSSALRDYGSAEEARKDALLMISALKENIASAPVNTKTFSNLLQIGDHCLIEEAFNARGVDAYLNLEKHSSLSYKGAIGRRDLPLLKHLYDLGFTVGGNGDQIFRAAIEADHPQMARFAIDTWSNAQRSNQDLLQIPYYIRKCGPGCAPILDAVLTLNMNTDWALNALKSAIAKVDVKVSTVLVLYGVTLPETATPDITVKAPSDRLFQHLSQFFKSSHAKLRLMALQQERIAFLGRGHLREFAGVSRSKLLTQNL
jgi:hypothetical protein